MVIKRNDKYTGVHSLDGEAVEKVIKNATLSEKKKSKAGRKPKSQEDKATEPLVVYVTPEQKGLVQEYCEKTTIPFSTLIKQFLNEKGIL